MFSIQVVLQFVSVAAALLSAPALGEFAAWVACAIFVWVLSQAARTLFPWLPHTAPLVPQGGGGFEHAAQGSGGRGRMMSPRRGREDGSPEAEGSPASFSYQTPAPRTGVRKRLSEKRQMELGYRGPLTVTEQDNPFHTRGAAEYISEKQYEMQADDFTKKVMVDLAEYVRSSDYLEQNADRLTARARRGLARQIALENEYEMPAGYYDE